MSLTLTILGCGSSGGVPRVGQGGWGACDPQNPKNRRRRCSLHVEKRGPRGATDILVDASPDLREQLLDLGAAKLDAVLLTHAHADHIHGVDDVRPLVIDARKRIPACMDAATSAEMHAKFGYIFKTPPGSNYPPLMDEVRIEPGRAFAVEGLGGPVETTPILFRHGEIDALGFRFGAVAYSPDLKDIPPASQRLLEGLDLWIIDALRYVSHPSHITVAEALAWIERLQPRRAILTNLHVDLDYEKLRAQLPPHIAPAFDGMRIEIDAGSEIRTT
ncbi:MAG: MBL fold metallo-hydrolase [Hyphomicrobiales bacterium]|nr:MBL fold metallo-hydrolase [Hyphomicrobiales bacterium]